MTSVWAWKISNWLFWHSLTLAMPSMRLTLTCYWGFCVFLTYLQHLLIGFVATCVDVGCVCVMRIHSLHGAISLLVLQSGVFSPLLFSLFINSITHSLTSSYHLYANDLQIYTQSSLMNLPFAIKVTSVDFKSILQRSQCFGLKVKPSIT